MDELFRRRVGGKFGEWMCMFVCIVTMLLRKIISVILPHFEDWRESMAMQGKHMQIDQKP